MSPVIARPAPASKDPAPTQQGAAREPQAEDLRALLDALFGSFERCLNDAGAAGATGAVGPKAPACPGAAVVDDLCRWAFFPESDELSLRRSYGRLTVALAIQTTEGRHVAKGLTIKDSLGDGVPMLMELPPPELLARTRAVREGLSLVLRIDNDRVQDPVAFSDSLRAFAKTTIVVGGTRYGRLPAGAAAAQVHRLDLSSLADDGADLRRCARELGKDLQVMRRLRVVRVPESWSGDWDFKQVCRRAGVDIEWVDAAGLAVGKTCHRGPRQTAVRLLRSCLS
jgi:hypothetical protein